MSTSEPRRSRIACSCSLRSKFTRWPGRSMRKTESLECVFGEVDLDEILLAEDDAIFGHWVV